MTRNRKSRKPPQDLDVRGAAGAIGWLVPQSEQDVLRAEAQLAEHPVELPADLADPAAARRRAESAPRPLRLGHGGDIERDLARAARQGGDIPPEIEQIMRRDRLSAEREMDHGQKNTTEDI